MDILQDYDFNSENIESFSWCPGYNNYLDLSQFEEHEIIFSKNFDTYCVKYFCGRKENCIGCEHSK